MLRLKRFYLLVKNLPNYLYYFKSTITKNSYPFKLIGEKVNFNTDDPTILFKILGKKGHQSLSLSNILENKNFISSFSPNDALLLGNMSFSSLFTQNLKEYNQFQITKEFMLNSTHDFFHSFKLNLLNKKESQQDNPLSNPEINFILKQNIYPYKLEGYEEKNNQLIIIYTIYGKRDGFKKNIKSIITDPTCLSKFHPTEAVKLGFISSGEFFFKNLNLN